LFGIGLFCRLTLLDLRAISRRYAISPLLICWLRLPSRSAARSSTLRVSVPFTNAEVVLARKLPAFRQRYPDVRVVLTIDNRMIDLQTE
jgi:DNA-binding transcriptional LysR family regulator